MNQKGFNKFIEYTVLFGLFIALVGSCYIFIVTIVFQEKSFAGFFNTWQFPMLMAIFIDSVYHEFVKKL